MTKGRASSSETHDQPEAGKQMEGIFDPSDIIQSDLEKTEDIETTAEVEELLDDESEQSYEEGLDDGLSQIVGVREHSVVKKREDTRSQLAIIYTVSTFFVFMIGMLLAVVDAFLNEESTITQNLSEIIPLISGVFLGSLGFVLGYYFRKTEDQ